MSLTFNTQTDMVICTSCSKERVLPESLMDSCERQNKPMDSQKMVSYLLVLTSNAGDMKINIFLDQCFKTCNYQMKYNFGNADNTDSSLNAQ